MRCSGCDRWFAGINFFDRHRDQYGPRGRCLDPSDLRNKDGSIAMVLRTRHGKQVWGGPEATAAQKEALAALRPPKDEDEDDQTD